MSDRVYLPVAAWIKPSSSSGAGAASNVLSQQENIRDIALIGFC
jgi:hypothetical protein